MIFSGVRVFHIDFLTCSIPEFSSSSLAESSKIVRLGSVLDKKRLQR